MGIQVTSKQPLLLRKKILVTFITLALLATGHAQILDKVKLDSLFERLDEKNKAMGSLNISKNGNVLYTRIIGFSQINGTEKKPLTIASRYRVGSITKMFTATIIFQLIDEGKLNLNDSLEKFFPKIPNAGRITIAQILAHRSGIHDISEDPEFRARRLNGITKDELLGLIVKSKPDFDPGTRYAYSNAGFQVLGMLVEKLSGKSYEKVIKDGIISRIGLKDTYVGTGKIDVINNECFSYKYGHDWEQQPETNMSLLFGSGSLISTPGDLAIFAKALFDGKLVSQGSLKQMMENKLGIDSFVYNGKTFYGHTGGVDGFGAWLAYLPEEKLAVSYTTNGKVYPVSNIIDGAIDIYYNKPFQVPSFKSLEINPEVLDKYVGVYSREGAPVKFTVTRDGATLFVEVTGKSAIPLVPTAQDKFKIESVGIEIIFDMSKKQMTIVRDGKERVLTKEN